LEIDKIKKVYDTIDELREYNCPNFVIAKAAKKFRFSTDARQTVCEFEKGTQKIMNAFINRGDKSDLALIAYIVQDYGFEILPKGNYFIEKLATSLIKGKSEEEFLNELKKLANSHSEVHNLILGTDKVLGSKTLDLIKSKAHISFK